MSGDRLKNDLNSGIVKARNLKCMLKLDFFYLQAIERLPTI